MLCFTSPAARNALGLRAHWRGCCWGNGSRVSSTEGIRLSSRDGKSAGDGFWGVLLTSCSLCTGSSLEPQERSMEAAAMPQELPPDRGAHELFGYVGIEAVLEQMKVKTMKMGFEFNIMVVGECLGRGLAAGNLMPPCGERVGELGLWGDWRSNRLKKDGSHSAVPWLCSLHSESWVMRPSFVLQDWSAPRQSYGGRL